MLNFKQALQVIHETNKDEHLSCIAWETKPLINTEERRVDAEQYQAELDKRAK